MKYKYFKSISILFIFLILLNSSGIQFHIHFCKEKISHFVFYCSEIDDTLSKKNLCSYCRHIISSCCDEENYFNHFAHNFIHYLEYAFVSQEACCIDKYIIILNDIESVKQSSLHFFLYLLFINLPIFKVLLKNRKIARAKAFIFEPLSYKSPIYIKNQILLI